jgi:membrane fusion protein (multidrug efflux system)
LENHFYSGVTPAIKAFLSYLQQRKTTVMTQNNQTPNVIVNWKTGLLALCCGLTLTACNRKAQTAPAALAPEVATLTVTEQRTVLTTELPGRTSAFRVAEIRPQVNGLVMKRFFTEGSDVKAGQELYQIDPAPFQAALDNAMAALGRSEANLPSIQLRVDRYKQALADKAVSQQDYDDAAAALKQAMADVQYFKAMVETAQINLGYTHVVSPITGRIGKSTVTEGAIVTAYQPTPLATIQQQDPIYVDVPQSTDELQRLRSSLEEKQITRNGTNANQVRIILGQNKAYPLEGTLQFRDISVDPTTASVILRMVFPNPKGVLLPGMFVRTVVEEGVDEQAILVPQKAVSRDQKGNPLVFLLGKDGKVEQRMLGLDRTIGSQWLVSSGLAPGDKVIIDALQQVRPGAMAREVSHDGTPAQRAKLETPAETASTQN